MSETCTVCATGVTRSSEFEVLSSELRDFRTSNSFPVSAFFSASNSEPRTQNFFTRLT